MKIFVALFCLISLSVGANNKHPKLIKALKSYKGAQYFKALELLKSMPPQEYKRVSANYMRGLSHFSLQQYNEANTYFDRTIRFKEHPEDTHYFYAQSLLAIGKVTEAKEQFKSSFRSGYRQNHSKYYTHYIEKDLSDFPRALIGFNEIYAHNGNALRQPAKYEYAKILLSQLKQSQNPSKKKAMEVYNELKLAYNVDPKSKIAEEIERTYFIVDSEYKLKKETFANGMRKPQKNLYLNLTEHFYYDSNVASLSDTAVSAGPTDVSSYVSSTKVTASYRHHFSEYFTSQPIVGLDYLKHTNTDSSAVYSNDSLVSSLDINNSYKHNFLGKPSSFLLEFGHNNTQKDRLGVKELKNYGSNSYISLGESLKYFKAGFTTLKYKYNIFKAFSESLDNTSHSLTAMQYINRENKDRVVLMANLSLTDSETDTSDSNTFALSTSYIMPEFFPKYNVTLGMKVSFTDPVNMRDSRGLETLYNPSVEVGRNFHNLFGDNDLFCSFLYGYKLNNSEDSENYGYSKNELGIKGKLLF